MNKVDQLNTCARIQVSVETLNAKLVTTTSHPLSDQPISDNWPTVRWPVTCYMHTPLVVIYRPDIISLNSGCHWPQKIHRRSTTHVPFVTWTEKRWWSFLSKIAKETYNWIHLKNVMIKYLELKSHGFKRLGLLTGWSSESAQQPRHTTKTTHVILHTSCVKSCMKEPIRSSSFWEGFIAPPRFLPPSSIWNAPSPWNFTVRRGTVEDPAFLLGTDKARVLPNSFLVTWKNSKTKAIPSKRGREKTKKRHTWEILGVTLMDGFWWILGVHQQCVGIFFQVP